MTIFTQHPWVDASRHPLYVCNYPNSGTEDQVRSYLQAFEEHFLALHTPYALVANTTGAGYLSSTQRRLFAESELRTKEHDAKYLAAIGMVVGSSMLRGVITAIHWISPPVYPHKTFADVNQAIIWTQQMLDQHVVK